MEKTTAVRGDLAYRLLLNYSILESCRYRADYIFTADKSAWYGDWEGRTILALVRLCEATGREPAFLEQIIDALGEHLNEMGYLGKVFPDGEFSEQQLAGHNWLLSGLIEYYLITGKEEIYNLIENIINNLYLKAKTHYCEYPIERNKKNGGGFSGENSGRCGCWHLSTDIGCAFICMDALSKACLELKRWELLPLLTEMYGVFSKIDFAGLQMQTHATLSATRGVIRLYKITDEKKYLETAERIFKLYVSEGMTENYANINWFGRPSWTEPCTVVDSVMCAVELYKLTHNSDYLAWFHKIYLNALGYALRPNGGFGLDVCVGYGKDFIRPVGEDMSIAYWCCTMRGGDGLAYCAENQILRDGNTFEILYYNDGLYKFGETEITEKTEYPYIGKTDFRIVNPQRDNLIFKAYIPKYADNLRILKDGTPMKINSEGDFALISISEKECDLTVKFDIPLIRLRADCPEYRNTHIKLGHGYLLLGTDSGCADNVGELSLTNAAKCIYTSENGSSFAPLNNICETEVPDVESEHRRILFEI